MHANTLKKLKQHLACILTLFQCFLGQTALEDMESLRQVTTIPRHGAH
jgi:hypothetical protein